MSASRPPVTRKTLLDAIECAIAECTALKEPTDGKEPTWQMQEDISAAMTNLVLIRNEMDGSVPTREIATRGFARYVVDEDTRMEMPKEIMDYIAKIEDVYVTKAWKSPSR